MHKVLYNESQEMPPEEAKNRMVTNCWLCILSSNSPQLLLSRDINAKHRPQTRQPTRYYAKQKGFHNLMTQEIMLPTEQPERQTIMRLCFT